MECLARELLDLHRDREQAVLELACGTGNLTCELGRPVGLAVGVDVSETMLVRAAERARGVGLSNVAYVRAAAEALPFATGVFDAVCCFVALHLFADPFGALGRVHDILRPRGGSRSSPRCAALPHRRVRSSRRSGVLTGLRLFGRDELVDALRRCGFEVANRRIAGLTQVWRHGAAEGGARPPSATRAAALRAPARRCAARCAAPRR